MNNDDKVEVYIEIKSDNLHVSSKFSGDVKSVISSIQKFLYSHFPQLSVVSKILVNMPSSEEMINFLSDDIKISGNEIILIRKPKDTVDGIRKLLLAARLMYDLGLRQSPALSIKELATIMAVSQKTIGNNLSTLVKLGEVERVDKGIYKISDRGILTSLPLGSDSRQDIVK